MFGKKQASSMASNHKKSNWKENNAIRKSLLLLSLVILCNGYVMVILGNLQNKHFCFVQKIGIIGNCGYLVLLLD